MDFAKKHSITRRKTDFNMNKNYDKKNNINEDIPQDIIYGRNPVIEALRSGAVPDCIYISSRKGTLGQIYAAAKEKGITVKEAPDSKITEMTKTTSHQGTAALMPCGKYITLEELLEIPKEKNKPAFFIMCEKIEDPHNLGAIIRTAETAGADGIIIPKRRSATLNAAVYKSSAGAASYLPAAKVSNLSSAIDTLKKSGIWIYGTDASGTDYTETDLTGNICLVIGSEGKGIGKITADKCDFMLKLPMYGKITSLNASVAAGIFMYEAVRQRRIKERSI